METKNDVKVYTVERFKGGVVLAANGKTIPPYQSLKVFNHSPTGFEFGYPGSGPAQLALAILLDFLEDEQAAESLHHEFKRVFIEPPCGDALIIDGSEISRWIVTERMKMAR